MSASPNLELPQELIDKIIDYVAGEFPGDKENELRACSLACRSFQPQSQRHLFYCISLESDNSHPSTHGKCKSACQRLYDVLKKKSELAEYIRMLDVELSKDTERNSWIYKDKAFIRIVGRVSKSRIPFQKLVMRKTPFEETRLASLAGSGSIIARYISPSLTFLQLSHIGHLPMEVLTSCMCLKILNLSHVDLEEGTSSHSTTPRCTKRPLIEGLNTDSCPIIMKRLTTVPEGSTESPFDFSALRNMYADIEHKDSIINSQTIIDIASSSLKEIHFRSWKKGYIPLVGLVDLSNLTQVRIIDSDIIIDHPNRPQEEKPLRDFSHILGTVPNNNQVETIFVGFNVGFHRQLPDSSLFEAGWDDLGAAVRRIASGRPVTLGLVLWLRYEHMRKSELERRCRYLLHGVEEKLLASISGSKIYIETSYKVR